MKSLASILMIVLCAPALAQGPSLNSILIGDLSNPIRLYMGTPKESVLSILRKSYSVEESGGDFIVSSKNAPRSSPYAIIAFRGDRLSSVNKSWCCFNDDSGVAVVRAIYGALSSVGTSSQSCTVTTFDTPNPNLDKRGLDILCGPREVQIFTNRWTFNTGSGEGAVVNEVLGEP